jgi:hypothetical protein
MPIGRWVPAAGAAAAFLLAGYSAVTESMPELRIYDGYRMILGAVLAVGVVAPFVWRWRRERSLAMVIVASIVGCWLPIVWLAVRRGTPVIKRILGAWYLMGGDVVAGAIPVGVACLWLVLRGPGPARQP